MMKSVQKMVRLAPLRYRTVTPVEEIDLGALVAPPTGFLPTNPSLARLGNRFVANIRCVNYRLRSERTLKSDFLVGSDWQSRNRVISWSDDPADHVELSEMSDCFAGVEDIRMLVIKNRLFASGTHHAGGRAVMKSFEFDETLSLLRKRDMPSPFGFGQEKNWAPFEKDGQLYFVYSIDPLIILRAADNAAGYDIVNGAGCAAGDISFTTGGSSQGIPHKGGWLFIFHRRRVQPLISGTIYVHYCVWISRDFKTMRKGPPFVIGRPAIHFVGGMVEHEGSLLISYGRADCKAWLARIAWHDLRVPIP